MCDWLYLIKNCKLYKIGITKNIDKRMRKLSQIMLSQKYIQVILKN